MEKERERAKIGGVIQAETSAAEIAEDLQKERRTFQLQMCEVGTSDNDDAKFLLQRKALGTQACPWTQGPSLGMHLPIHSQLSFSISTQLMGVVGGWSYGDWG